MQIYKACSCPLLVKNLNWQGKEFENISKNQLLMNVSELNVWGKRLKYGIDLKNDNPQSLVYLCFLYLYNISLALLNVVLSKLYLIGQRFYHIVDLFDLFITLKIQYKALLNLETSLFYHIFHNLSQADQWSWECSSEIWSLKTNLW